MLSPSALRNSTGQVTSLSVRAASCSIVAEMSVPINRVGPFALSSEDCRQARTQLRNGFH